MTRQEMFDKVYIGLLNQKFERSMKNYAAGSACAYRGKGGMKCAAGHLIPDEEYRPEMDDSALNLESLKKLELLPKCFQNLSEDDFDFIGELQDAHDSSFTPTAMKHAIKEVAFQYGLNIPED